MERVFPQALAKPRAVSFDSLHKQIIDGTSAILRVTGRFPRYFLSIASCTYTIFTKKLKPKLNANESTCFTAISVTGFSHFIGAQTQGKCRMRKRKGFTDYQSPIAPLQPFINQLTPASPNNAKIIFAVYSTILPAVS